MSIKIVFIQIYIIAFTNYDLSLKTPLMQI
jgi:hypothetical protein